MCQIHARRRFAALSDNPQCQQSWEWKENHGASDVGWQHWAASSFLACGLQRAACREQRTLLVPACSAHAASCSAPFSLSWWSFSRLFGHFWRSSSPVWMSCFCAVHFPFCVHLEDCDKLAGTTKETIWILTLVTAVLVSGKSKASCSFFVPVVLNCNAYVDWRYCSLNRSHFRLQDQKTPHKSISALVWFWLQGNEGKTSLSCAVN